MPGLYYMSSYKSHKNTIYFEDFKELYWLVRGMLSSVSGICNVQHLVIIFRGQLFLAIIIVGTVVYVLIGRPIFPMKQVP